MRGPVLRVKNLLSGVEVIWCRGDVRGKTPPNGSQLNQIDVSRAMYGTRTVGKVSRCDVCS